MPGELRATLLLPADALPAPSPDIAPLLANVEKLLADVRDRLNETDGVLVGSPRAAELLGISERTLADLDVPSVRIGSRRLYRIETLRAWAAEREDKQ